MVISTEAARQYPTLLRTSPLPCRYGKGAFAGGVECAKPALAEASLPDVAPTVTPEVVMPEAHSLEVGVESVVVSLPQEVSEREAQEEAFWSAAQSALRERERREKVGAFLKANGFTGVNSANGWLFSYSYPLHVAVEKKDAEMVCLLIESKADKKLKDSKGRTPRRLARHRNLYGSHRAVLQALGRSSRKKRAIAAAAASAAAAEAPAKSSEDFAEIEESEHPPVSVASCAEDASAAATDVAASASKIEGTEEDLAPQDGVSMIEWHCASISRGHFGPQISPQPKSGCAAGIEA
eukprot:CAMPEP_0117481596 /NCGR_PEP_ID=MMETSP0784-20121206/12981_1 /TAXON_ID=39447 /ORGANISM="" /LENGTH=294 /DNA_ID=CAMNT_0005276057 /DNA_START=65 /DNA_END=947 /DNA_ORIENTATION=-